MNSAGRRESTPRGARGAREQIGALNELLYERLECSSAALADLERFLELVPSGKTADTVRDEIPRLRKAVADLH